MKEKLLRIWKIIKSQKSYLVVSILSLCVVSGCFITISSAREKSAIKVSSLQTQVQNRTKEVEDLTETISQLGSELSELRLEVKNKRRDLELYYHKEYQQDGLYATIKELNETTKELEEENLALRKQNETLTKKVKRLTAKVSK